MKIRPLTSNFGAEILDFSFSSLEDLKNALYENELLLIRGLDLDEKNLIQIAKSFGNPKPFPIKKYQHPEYPEVLITSNEKKDGVPLGVARVGTFWHSDSSYLPNPAPVTILHGRTIPNVGGRTFFISMTHAYERLSKRMKDFVSTHDATHTIRKRYKVSEEDVGRSIAELHEDLKKRHPDSVHPLVKKHPYTGKKALYFSEGYTLKINGLEPTEDQKYLNELDQHCTQEEHVYCHVWKKNDVLIWDNRSLNHAATPSPEPRTLYRVSVAEVQEASC